MGLTIEDLGKTLIDNLRHSIDLVFPIMHVGHDSIYSRPRCSVGALLRAVLGHESDTPELRMKKLHL